MVRGVSPFFFVQSSRKENKLSRENPLKKESKCVWLWDCAYSGTSFCKSGRIQVIVKMEVNKQPLCHVFTRWKPSGKQSLIVAEFELILYAGKFNLWILVNRAL